MKRDFYGRKLFAADLAVVSVWALFALRVAPWYGWPVFIWILMRVALCFQMQRKSAWTLYSAVAFLICGCGMVCNDQAFYPIKRIAYYIGAWSGNGKEVMDALSVPIDQDLKVWLTIFAVFLYGWIFGLPIVDGCLQGQAKRIDWKRKWIRVFWIITMLLSLPVFNEAPAMGAFVFGALVGVLPVIYWCKYFRNRRSPFNLLCNYRPLVIYVSFAVVLLLCLMIGVEGSITVKTIALIVMPVILYGLICRSCGVKALTRYAVVLAISCWLYIFLFTAPGWVKIITLSVSGILALYVGIAGLKEYKSRVLGLVLFLMPVGVVAPLILGMNPYVGIDVESVYPSYFGYSGKGGHFVIEKDWRYGIRDRFGVILDPGYTELQSLDMGGRYVAFNLSEAGLISSQRWGVYDVVAHEFLLDPNDVEVARIVQTGKLSFTLYSPDESVMAILNLRGFHPDKNEFVAETAIIPYHAPAELTTEPDSELGKNAEELGNSQQGDNAEAMLLTERARTAVNSKYSDIIEKYPSYRKVYDRWSDLMESMTDYLVDVTYGEPRYSMQPIQYNRDIREWYDYFLEEVKMDYEILYGDKNFTVKVGSIIDKKTSEAIFNSFKPKKAGGYNAMWNEVRPAFLEWEKARADYAEKLDPHKRLSYAQHTAELRAYLAKEIKGLTVSRNDNTN